MDYIRLKLSWSLTVGTDLGSVATATTHDRLDLNLAKEGTVEKEDFVLDLLMENGDGLSWSQPHWRRCALASIGGEAEINLEFCALQEELEENWRGYS